MENISEQQRPKSRTIAERFKELESRLEEDDKDKKPFKIPFKWKWKFNQARKKAKQNQLPVMIFTKDGYLNGPTYLPVRYGNLITWNEQAYKFRPEALWKFRDIKSEPFVYIIIYRLTRLYDFINIFSTILILFIIILASDQQIFV